MKLPCNRTGLHYKGYITCNNHNWQPIRSRRKKQTKMLIDDLFVSCNKWIVWVISTGLICCSTELEASHINEYPGKIPLKRKLKVDNTIHFLMLNKRTNEKLLSNAPSTSALGFYYVCTLKKWQQIEIYHNFFFLNN